jgi:rRNA maturation endonuclease Nob1
MMMSYNQFEVTEVCPNCESEVTMVRDVSTLGYKSFCPVCGERLMLCDMCHHRGENDAFVDDCDYDSETDTCRFNN